MKPLLSLLVIAIFFLLTSHAVHAQINWSDYHLTWDSQSKNSSESMPCGGGDIGMNVWVEQGDLLIYIAKSGNFDENNALMKTGRLRIRTEPSIFDAEDFKQTLLLEKGYLVIEAKKDKVELSIRVWADVFRSVAHVDVQCNRNITVKAAYESWRYRDRIIRPRENFGNSWKWAAPKNNVYKKDSIAWENNRLLFYHHNTAETIFDATVTQQGLDSVKNHLYNPLKHRVFGGSFSGDNFVAAETYEGVYVDTDFRGYTLRSRRPAKRHSIQVVLHNAQTPDISQWKNSLDSLDKKVSADRLAALKSEQWWKQFWQRSFIFIDKTKKQTTGWEVGRNYQLFRYMLACNAGGEWPTKFNGGLLTVDPVFTDTAHHLTPDYRNWGGGLHTMQNQRLVYFPMIKSGDWDLLQSQLDFYQRIRNNAEWRSRVYWNHEGACFTEQMENFGLPNYAEYGQKRPDYFDKGVEFNAWLEYEWDTVFEFCLMMLDEHLYTGRSLDDRLPFIESCLRFFDEHYQYLARRRGSKALDGEGKLILYPGSAAETFKMAYNSTSTVAALRTILERMINLQVGYVSDERKASWESILNRIPGISYGMHAGQVTLAPAKSWERINNVESPQFYPVFPWRIYGVGKPGLDTAMNTWLYDTNVVKFRSHVGWKQDNIWAACLGLTNEAWMLTSLKLQNSERRFPAFWGPGFDWVPDHNWGGSGMIGLQEMLLQCDQKRILLFPAWPKDKDVYFRLHAPFQTIVEAELRNGEITRLEVTPDERKNDVEILLK